MKLPDEVKDTVDNLYAMGAIRSANIYLRKMAQENEDIAMYIEDKDMTARVCGQNLITTHARLFHLSYTNDTWIIDEDIMIVVLKFSYILFICNSFYYSLWQQLMLQDFTIYGHK